MPFPSGASFAGYTLVRLLASGGLTEVYLAEHPRMPGSVVLTVLNVNAAAEAGAKERFAGRAAAVVSFDHPHVLRPTTTASSRAGRASRWTTWTARTASSCSSRATATGCPPRLP